MPTTQPGAPGCSRSAKIASTARLAGCCDRASVGLLLDTVTSNVAKPRADTYLIEARRLFEITTLAKRALLGGATLIGSRVHCNSIGDRRGCLSLSNTPMRPVP